MPGKGRGTEGLEGRPVVQAGLTVYRETVPECRPEGQVPLMVPECLSTNFVILLEA